MKVESAVILIQARSGSSRLPGKIYRGLPDEGHASILMHIHRRLRDVPGIEALYFLIPDSDAELVHYCERKSLPFLTGPEEDVRERYRRAARRLNASIVVRATGDNPCVDGRVVADTIRSIRESGADLFSYSNLPLGVAVEAMRREALMDDTIPATTEHREHVSLHIKHNPAYFNVIHSSHPLMDAFSGATLPRLTVDTAEDLSVVRNIYRHLGDSFETEDVMELYRREPELFVENARVQQITFPASR